MYNLRWHQGYKFHHFDNCQLHILIAVEKNMEISFKVPGYFHTAGFKFLPLNCKINYSIEVFEEHFRLNVDLTPTNNDHSQIEVKNKLTYSTVGTRISNCACARETINSSIRITRSAILTK